MSLYKLGLARGLRLVQEIDRLTFSQSLEFAINVRYKMVQVCSKILDFYIPPHFSTNFQRILQFPILRLSASHFGPQNNGKAQVFYILTNRSKSLEFIIFLNMRLISTLVFVFVVSVGDF